MPPWRCPADQASDPRHARRGISADDDRFALGDGDGHPVRPRYATDVPEGKLMGTQPGRESILVAADLDPGDAHRGTTMLDDRAAGVVHVIDMPLDEERQTLGHGCLEAHEVPRELDAVGTCATHQQCPAPDASGHGFHVVGAQAQRRGSFTDFDETASHPRPEWAGSRLVAVEHRHELDVAATERHYAVACAMASVTPTRNRCQARLVVTAAGSGTQVRYQDDYMVDRQHLRTISGAPGGWGRRVGARFVRDRAAMMGGCL